MKTVQLKIYFGGFEEKEDMVGGGEELDSFHGECLCSHRWGGVGGCLLSPYGCEEAFHMQPLWLSGCRGLKQLWPPMPNLTQKCFSYCV